MKGHRRNVARTKKDRKRSREKWFEKDNITKIEIAYDCCFSLQPVNRLESHSPSRGGFQE